MFNKMKFEAAMAAGGYDWGLKFQQGSSAGGRIRIPFEKKRPAIPRVMISAGRR